MHDDRHAIGLTVDGYGVISDGNITERLICLLRYHGEEGVAGRDDYRIMFEDELEVYVKPKRNH